MTEELDIVEQAEEAPQDLPKSEPETDMLSKSTVSKIVERERLKAYEKAKKEVMMELQQQQAQQPVEQGQPQQAPQMQQQAPQQLGGMQQMSPEQIEQMIMQKAPQALMQQVEQMKTQNMVDTFVGKMQSAEQRYPGLEDKLNKLNYYDPRMHKLIEMSNGIENTGDVMHELIANPHKMSVVLSDIMDQPYLAQQQLMSLSNSIKTNQQALAEDAKTKDPMSQLKPSINTGLADNSNLSIVDLQRMLSKR